MYLLIDRDKMCVRHRHPQLSVLLNMAHIEVSHCATFITPEEFPVNFDSLTDLELKLLYQNMCGQKYTAYPNKESLISAVMQLCRLLPESKINGFEASLQSASISEANAGFYKYAPGCANASAQQELYTPAALVTGAALIPVHTPTISARAAPTPVAVYANPITTQAVAAPYVAAKSSAPATATSAPKSGKTARVWEIAEGILEQYPARPTDWKLIRKLVVEACEAEGINGSTAGVQYSKFKVSKT